jgi:hypothetical protein
LSLAALPVNRLPTNRLNSCIFFLFPSFNNISPVLLFSKAYDRWKPENDQIIFRDEYLKNGSAELRESTKFSKLF